MKNAILLTISLLTILIIAHGNPGEHTYSQQVNASTSGMDQNGTKRITIPDAQTGRPMFYMTIPSNWQSTDQGLTGPHNLRAADIPEQSYQSNQGPIIQPQAVTQEVLGMLKQNRTTVTGTFNIESISANQKRLDDQRWKYAPVQYTATTTGIECVDPQGTPFLIILMHNQTRSQFYNGWGYTTQMMTCDKSYYPQAKAQVIRTLASITYDQQYINQFNQAEQQRSATSDQAFSNRMRNNQANFEKQNKATVDAQNAVNSMSMQGYNERSASQDRLQQNNVRSINETQIMIDPYSDQRYEVQGQASYYWIDAQGNYFPTNDPNYNPNTDPSNNGRQWRQMKSGGGNR